MAEASLVGGRAADPVVLLAIENLAAVRLAQKQYAEAQHLFERARKAWEELRPGAPEAAIALNGLGAVALRNKRKDRAAMLFREAIDRWQPDTEPLLLAQQVYPTTIVISSGKMGNPPLSQRSRRTGIMPSVRRLALMHPLTCDWPRKIRIASS